MFDTAGTKGYKMRKAGKLEERHKVMAWCSKTIHLPSCLPAFLILLERWHRTRRLGELVAKNSVAPVAWSIAWRAFRPLPSIPGTR
jgi:hypothetical protein